MAEGVGLLPFALVRLVLGVDLGAVLVPRLRQVEIIAGRIMGAVAGERTIARPLDDLGDGLETMLDAPIALGFIAYLVAASRRLYAGGWFASIVKAVLLIGWLAACLTIYRFILFFTTFAAT